MDLRTAHALVRFGMGSGGAEPAPADPAAWLLDQLRHAEPQADAADGLTASQGLAALRADREDKPPPAQSRVRAVYQAQGNAAVAHAVATSTPFRERLVWFWTNHFTVSVRKGRCAALIGPFVQDTIRPHVTGRFEDMLLAAMRHPARRTYLDNAQPVGPGGLGAGAP